MRLLPLLSRPRNSLRRENAVSIGQRECDEASDTPLEFSVRRARQILVGQKRYKKHWHTITPWVLGGVLETLDAETARADRAEERVADVERLESVLKELQSHQDPECACYLCCLDL